MNTLLAFVSISDWMLILTVMFPILLIYLFVKLVMVSYSTRNTIRELVENQQVQNDLLKDIAEQLKSKS